MGYLWLAEHETNVAQPSLISLLDRFMWKLDYRHHGRNENHWSLRSGLPRLTDSEGAGRRGWYRDESGFQAAEPIDCI